MSIVILLNARRRKTWPIDLVTKIRLLDRLSAMHSYLIQQVFFTLFDRDLKYISPQLSVLIGFPYGIQIIHGESLFAFSFLVTESLEF